MTQIKIGDEAPDFDLPGDGGNRVALSQHRGSIVVLFFYPKDNTAGCTAEAVDFTALADEFAEAGAVLIGMSADSAKSHDRFKAKHALSMALAADEDKAVLEAYGVWTQKQMYGRSFMGVERTTVLIGADGRVARIWNRVKVPGHAAEVLAATRALAGE